MGYCSCSQKMWFIIILVLLLFAAETQGSVALAWLSLAILFGIMLLLDYMFMNDKDFLYDPDYKTWKQKTQVEM